MPAEKPAQPSNRPNCAIKPPQLHSSTATPPPLSVRHSGLPNRFTTSSSVRHSFNFPCKFSNHMSRALHVGAKTTAQQKNATTPTANVFFAGCLFFLSELFTGCFFGGVKCRNGKPIPSKPVSRPAVKRTRSPLFAFPPPSSPSCPSRESCPKFPASLFLHGKLSFVCMARQDAVATSSGARPLPVFNARLGGFQWGSMFRPFAHGKRKDRALRGAVFRGTGKESTSLPLRLSWRLSSSARGGRNRPTPKSPFRSSRSSACRASGRACSRPRGLPSP